MFCCWLCGLFCARSNIFSGVDLIPYSGRMSGENDVTALTAKVIHVAQVNILRLIIVQDRLDNDSFTNRFLVAAAEKWYVENLSL